VQDDTPNKGIQSDIGASQGDGKLTGNTAAPETSAAVPSKPVVAVLSIHPFARNKPHKTQAETTKAEKKKKQKKKSQQAKKKILIGYEASEPKVSSAQEDVTTCQSDCNIEQNSVESIGAVHGVTGMSGDATPDVVISDKVQPSNPTREENQVSIPSFSSSPGLSEPDGPVPIDPQVRLSKELSTANTSTQVATSNVSVLLKQANIVPPAVPLLPRQRLARMAVNNSMPMASTKLSVALPGAEADSESDGSSRMSLKSAKEFQTPAPSPLPSSSSPPAIASSLDDFRAGLRTETPDHESSGSNAQVAAYLRKMIADSNASNVEHQRNVKKKPKKKKKTSSDNTHGEAYGAKRDNNGRSEPSRDTKDRTRGDFLPGEINDKNHESRTSIPGRDSIIELGKLCGERGDNEKSSVAQNTSFDRASKHKENALGKSSCGDVTKNENANAECTKEQPTLKIRDPNLPSGPK